jgi:hypothetical protein
MVHRKVIVTHHAPDLDAVGAVWLLKRFDAQHFATAKVAFVNPGEVITPQELQEIDMTDAEVVHVDTGQGEFDHHQPDRGHLMICATSLVYDFICDRYPDQKDDAALKALVEFVIQIDHFQEIHWPDAANLRYNFMVHELLHGMESQEPHDDDSMMQFGMTCLDCAYHSMGLELRAQELIVEKGHEFTLQGHRSLSIETENEATIKVAQKQGFILVVRKDPKGGHVRIKLRPDSELNLQAAYQAIIAEDHEGTWYYHPSGKMLLNGSSKHRNQTPSPLSLERVVELLEAAYA